MRKGEFINGHEKRAGRKKGVPNKVTVALKDVLQAKFGPDKVYLRLKKLIDGKDESVALRALELALNYAYGKPTQTINATIETIDRERAAQVFRDLFARGQEFSVSPSGQLVGGSGPVQDSEQGPPGNGHDNGHRFGGGDLGKDSGR